jgi:succinate dehydrogenase hydrophobic anchor subunit
VIEDYVHSHGVKLASLILSRFAHILLAAVGVYSILRLGIGA